MSNNQGKSSSMGQLAAMIAFIGTMFLLMKAKDAFFPGWNPGIVIKVIMLLVLPLVGAAIGYAVGRGIFGDDD